MAVVTNSVFLDILLVLLPILYLVYWFFTKNNDYWDKRGIPNSKLDQLLAPLLGKETQSEVAQNLYNQFPNEKFAGSFQMKKPVLMVRDPDLIHKILVKDFIHFQDRGNGRQFKKDDPLAGSLFNLEGQVWRSLRYKLTPTFTTGKLRAMFEQISKSGDNMIERIQMLVKENNEVDSKEFLFEFTLGVISSCAFGIQFKSDSPEYNTFKTTVQNLLKTSIKTLIRFSILFMSPKLADILNLTAFSKDITQYFVNLTKGTLEYRRTNNVHRNDYFQLLMTLKEQEDSGKEIVPSPSDATEEDAVIDQMRYAEQNGQPSAPNIKVMTDEAICANSVIFLLAGSDTVANTISFALLNLAQFPNTQKRLQQEVDTVLKQRGCWSYDTIKDMTYLDQVVQETQRMYPLVPILLRECVLPYKVPDSNLVIEKGVLVSIPVMGLHHDPQYYPEPERFNPDRFEDNNFKPNPTFLPFGDGPRICIAMRFAVLEVKTCLARIMSEYSVKLGSKTQTPIKFSRSTLSVSVEGGIWLNINKREKTI